MKYGVMMLKILKTRNERRLILQFITFMYWGGGGMFMTEKDEQCHARVMFHVIRSSFSLSLLYSQK